MSKKKTNEQFIYDIEQKHGKTITILDTYINNKIKVLCKCNICEYQWKALPGNLLSKNRKNGCPECAKKSLSKSHEDFISDLKDINPDIEILGKYKNINTKIQCRCKKCGYLWETTPNSLMQGKGCHLCANKKIGLLKIKSNDEFIEQMKLLNPNIKVLSKYNGNRKKVDCLCLIDNHKWEATPSNLLHGYGCPVCSNKRISKLRLKPQNDFILEMKLKHPNITVLGKYTGTNNKILCKCNDCGNEWHTTPSCLLTKNSGCPSCSSSNGEKIIKEYLFLNNIHNISQKRFDDLFGVNGGKLSYDFYIPDYNLLIEFQGIQHEKPIEYFGGEQRLANQQEHDRRKRQYAKDNNIRLLEIWYYDIDNIQNILDDIFIRKSA